MTQRNITIETVAFRPPNPTAPTKVYTCGNVIEVRSVAKHVGSISRYRRCGNDSCVNMDTGEVIQYHHSEKRIGNKRSLYKSFETLRRIINHNFHGGRSELFLTLTYKVKMTDQDQLYHDYRLLWKRLKRLHPSLEYVAIAEPQHTGSYHLHVLLRRSDYALLFISKDQLKLLWGHGNTHVQRLETVDNLGAYFTAHLTNDNLSEHDDAEEPQPKKIVKGARIAYYPARFKLYRYSKGIVKPIPQAMSYEQAKQMVNNLPPCYSSTKVIYQNLDDGTRQEVNSVTYEQFNIKRKNNY